MGFIFIGADWFGHTVVLSGEALRPASVTGPFDRESLNSAEQTFTVMVVSFMVAHAKTPRTKKVARLYRPELCALRFHLGVFALNLRCLTP